MDATMVSMRLASEQQLVPACQSSVDASRSAGGQNSPSIEALTTLLWATHVIAKEDAEGHVQQVDVTTEIRQACDELDGLFRQGKARGTRAPAGRGSDAKAQKSLDGWRLARF